ncbi:hypothetical protein JXA12_04645 [Candidatus Woesearchaeota archaeon]|nr:hypothetical protein [Candidatus Woesearchaeota archaeon]
MGLFNLLADLIGGTMRLAFTLIGTVLILAGIILSLTFIGAVIGIPLIIIGAICLVIGFSFAPRREAVRYVYVHKDRREQRRGRMDDDGVIDVEAVKK